MPVEYYMLTREKVMQDIKRIFSKVYDKVSNI